MEQITCTGLDLIISCNKTTETSEIQQLISKMIYNFFHMTGGDDKGSDTLSVKRLGQWQRNQRSNRRQMQNSSGISIYWMQSLA